MLLKPQAIFRDPFRGGKNIMVMCDCYKPDMTPIKNNTRVRAAELMEKVRETVADDVLPLLLDLGHSCL